MECVGVGGFHHAMRLFLTDVMSPLKPMLEKELLWDSLDYGILPVHTVGSMSLPLCLLSVVSFG